MSKSAILYGPFKKKIELYVEFKSGVFYVGTTTKETTWKKFSDISGVERIGIEKQEYKLEVRYDENSIIKAVTRNKEKDIILYFKPSYGGNIEMSTAQLRDFKKTFFMILKYSEPKVLDKIEREIFIEKLESK